MANGLDVKSSAVNGKVLVGDAFAFSKSRDADESAERDEKDSYHVVHQMTVSNCDDNCNPATAEPFASTLVHPSYSTSNCFLVARLTAIGEMPASKVTSLPACRTARASR